MPASRGARAPLVEKVVAQLEAVLATDEFSTGDRLPTEREMAAQFGVSRATVREALQELELKGRIERVQGRGTTVAAVSDSDAPGSGLLARLPPEERRVAELMDFRHAIEPVIASRAARYATAADVYQLERVTQEMAETNSADVYRELDERFHDLVARATHNSVFNTLVQMTWEALRPTRLAQEMDKLARDRALVDHRAVVQAIRERDAERAERAMRAHIEQVARDLGVMVEPAAAPPEAVADVRPNGT
ncbi:MAG: GntR family transcriptional regulator, transcriptional repressor for pyruvate dehydrogenase complex [Solirubrobacteraceae bacterium]|nr:GntR family transcriptional regulator, transcriptional repressor for pyruvate dehydrogenase complex [Solirubrobacteraceae bacterium]